MTTATINEISIIFGNIMREFSYNSYMLYVNFLQIIWSSVDDNFIFFIILNFIYNLFYVIVEHNCNIICVKLC
jgi:hypothetical protein